MKDPCLLQWEGLPAVLRRDSCFSLLCPIPVYLHALAMPALAAADDRERI